MRSLLPSSCPADRPPRTQRATLRARVRACLAPLAALALSCGLLLGGPGPAAAQTGPDASDEAVAQLEAGLHQQAAGRFYELYQVRPGDTVENIAARFGISPERIRTLNRVSPSAQPNPGRAIAIPITRPRPSAEMPAPAADPAPRDLQPRYASVIASTPIRTQPNSPSAEVLYQPELGAQLIVVAEQSDHWGVVMVDGSTGWIPKTSAQLTDQTIDPDTLDAMLKGGRPDIVQEAFRYLGTPYRYGGHLPYNLDCSLLVQTVFASRGLRLPRTANAQYDHGQSVNSSNLLPGDRLYFVSKSGRINHTGIYIGGGRFIHASSRRGRVAVDKLAEPMYRTRFAGARRS
jgi:cell wall-associated NlpC family hydrolase